ncbi:MAG: MFS transporter [Nitrososphaeria archaeon]
MNKSNPFTTLDNLNLSFKHVKIWYTSGMGFFTDAYDLFIISAVLDIFMHYALPGFRLNLFYIGVLTSSALFAAIIGQLSFGFLADRLGRKRVYGIEAAILALGAALSAFAPNILWLIIFRGIMGFGIGGDYPVSATIMSEYANVKDRGKLIALVFSNQGLGSMAAIAVGALSTYMLPADLAWRVMLFLGAVPALTIIYLRRTIPETPRYSAIVKRNEEQVKKAANFLGADINTTGFMVKKIGLSDFFKQYWMVLIGTAFPWFILDVAFYGTGIYSGPIISQILGPASSVGYLIIEQGLPFLVGFFGYFTAVAFMDRLGRKVIQIQGFIIMTAIYLTVSLVTIASGTKITGFIIPSAYAFVLYSLSFFFIDFGPNTTTFVIPAEVYPTQYRTTGHGISAAAGKLGAAITTFYFPTLMMLMGVRGILEMLSIISIVGSIITAVFLSEPKLKSLEEASNEELIAIPVRS